MFTKMKGKRMELGITQTELFLQIAIPQWRLSLIERGMPPKAEEAEKIAQALGTTADNLFPAIDRKSCIDRVL